MKSPFVKNENQTDFLEFFFQPMFFIFSTTKLGILFFLKCKFTNFAKVLEKIAKFSMSQNF
jgi:hypothetical protein